MNSYMRTVTERKGVYGELVGWRRAKDRRFFFGCVGLAATIYAVVWYTEEKEKRRRHHSIEKDIERERWRARELGLADPSDDGFAEEYLEEVRAKDRQFSIFPRSDAEIIRSYGPTARDYATGNVRTAKDAAGAGGK